MAVHGRLVTGSDAAPVQGYLASVRDVRLTRPGLDDASGDLIIDAERLMGDDSGATYRFTVTDGGAVLLEGRATVLFEVVP
jgi:predicted hotdog family 3-hydroxylacyl-ACP dehydratase